MGFQQGLSGLNISSKNLDVIGNNIANSSTVGFKAANAHFADVYASMLAGAGASQVGIGTTVMAVQQEFTQGNVTTTKNPLDIAINGDGFFRMSNNGTITYSRNGQFHLDKNGFIVDDRAETEYKLFSAEPCMENCREGEVKVTKRAIDLNVTPKDEAGRPLNTIPPYTEAAAAPEAGDAAPVEVAATDAPAAETPAAAAPEAEAVETAAAETEAVDHELVEDGEKVFKKCAACHKVGEGAKHTTGPSLNGVVGRTAGASEGYKYSKPMIDAGAGGLVWDAASIDAYLADPKGFIPKNKMSFAGLKKPEDRAAVIAYLATSAE